MASAQGLNYYSSEQPQVTIPEAFNGADSSYMSTGKSLGDKIVKALTGFDQEQAYQNALTKSNRAYEFALLNDARNYETWFDSTAVQRRVNDIKAAGLNPWLALQSGGISANGSSGSPTPGSSSSAKTVSTSGKGAASSLAMLLFATARLLAVL